MKLDEIDNATLFRQYGCTLKEIDMKHKQKKDFEEEIKRRFDENNF